MLRRNPTALTISSEDIAAFEETYARKIAYQRYLKTGEDPDGYFRNLAASGAKPGDLAFYAEQQSRMKSGSNSTAAGPGGVVDPNDELKPLPGDKARIVRSREERIMGTTAGGGGSGRQ